MGDYQDGFNVAAKLREGQLKTAFDRIVDLEQEIIRLKDENQELKEKAKAWDYLNHLINECRYEELTIAIKPHHNIKQFYIVDDLEKGGVYDSYNVFDKITVNSALKNINDGR